MAKWLVLCNGGPNNSTVGCECDSLGKACGRLENMIKSLCASIGQIERVKEGQQTLDQDCFVCKEQDAGRLEDDLEDDDDGQ